MKKEYEILFTPAKIGSLELKNRFVMVPMQPTALLEWTMHEKGFNPEVRDLLVNRAKDGIGLIIAGAVGPISMLNGKSLGKHPEMFEGVSELMEEIHSYGTKLFFQLTVGAGRNFPVMKGPDGKVLDIGIWQNIETKNQSADAGLPNRWVPELKTTQFTVEDIKATIESMAETAYLCKQNGVDGIDVHALHEGYLLDQFSLPYTNHRTDEYGGSLENRLRFACEIVKAIKEKCGQDYPVILRYSVTSKTRDFGKGIIPEDKDSVEIGRTLEESKKAIQILTEAGYDAFNADNGTYDAWYYAHPPVYMPLNCNLEESIAIKPFTDKPIINAGRLQLDVAADAISKGQLDFVGIARQFLVDEQYLTKIKEEREEDVIPCISCHTGCFPMGLWKDSGCKFGKLGSCALNPYTAHEKKFAVKQAENPKTVAVIGAGIAGMEFALQATKRGHKVTVYEKSDRLGGVFNEAANFTFKEKDRELLKYYETQMKKYEIDIRLNCEITDLSDIVADEIVIATGAASAKELHVEGNENTVNAIDFLANDLQCKDNVVIIGGGLTGCEIAYELAKAGKHPVVVELMNDILIAPGTCMANTGYLRDALEYYKVPVYLNSKTEKINTDSVEIITEDGNHEVLPSDTTVVSIGYTEGTSFETADDHVHIIGDANQVSNLYNAILAANELAISL